MAFPSVVSVTETLSGSFGTAHAVAYPAEVDAGDLLVFLVECNLGTSSLTEPGEVEKIAGGVFLREADGTEGGGSAEFTTASATVVVAQVLRIALWSGDLEDVSISGPVWGENNGPNPGGVVSSRGLADNLFVAVVLAGDDAAAVTSAPADYSGLVSTVVGVTNYGATVGSSYREKADDYDNPGPFSLSSVEAYVTYTICIPPLGVSEGVGTAQAGASASAEGLGLGTGEGAGSAAGGASAGAAGEAIAEGVGVAVAGAEVEGEAPPPTFGRGWPAAMNTALDETVKRLGWLVKAEFDSGTARHWTGYGTLKAFDPEEEYLGTGLVMGFSPISESQDVKSTGIVITLRGVSNSLIALALTEPYQGRPCTIYMAMFDEDMQLVADPQPVFSGRMDVIETDPQPGGTAHYALSVESHMVDLRKARTRYYTSEDQQAFYPGDTFFDRVPQLQNARVVWGKS